MPAPAGQQPWRATEQQLVARAVAGEVAAFEGIYRQHVGRVYALCLRMTADVPRAEAATQETFVRAWKSLPGFRGDASLATWLCHVAASAVVDEVRRQGRHNHLELLEEDAPAATQPLPDAGLDMEKALARLPPGARMVLVLHDLHGFNHQEIAQRLGVASGTSKSQLARARRLLREAWTQ